MFQKPAIRKRGEIILEKHGYLKKNQSRRCRRHSAQIGQMPSSCSGGRTISGHPAFEGFSLVRITQAVGEASWPPVPPSDEFCKTALQKSAAKSQFTKSTAGIIVGKGSKGGRKGRREGRGEGRKKGKRREGGQCLTQFQNGHCG